MAFALAATVIARLNEIVVRASRSVCIPNESKAFFASNFVLVEAKTFKAFAGNLYVMYYLLINPWVFRLNPTLYRV